MGFPWISLQCNVTPQKSTLKTHKNMRATCHAKGRKYFGFTLVSAYA